MAEDDRQFMQLFARVVGPQVYRGDGEPIDQNGATAAGSAVPAESLLTDVWAKTCCTTHHVTFKWVIENFSSYCVANPEEYPSMVSPKFGFPQHSSLSSSNNNSRKVRFYLRFYPKGKKEENKGYLSVFLHYQSQESFRVKFSISVLNAQQEKRHTISKCGFISIFKSHFFINFFVILIHSLLCEILSNLFWLGQSEVY